MMGFAVGIVYLVVNVQTRHSFIFARRACYILLLNFFSSLSLFAQPVIGDERKRMEQSVQLSINITTMFTRSASTIGELSQLRSIRCIFVLNIRCKYTVHACMH